MKVIHTTPKTVSMFPQSHLSSRIRYMVTSIAQNEHKAFHSQKFKDPLKVKRQKKSKMDKYNITVQRVSSHVKNHFLSQVRQLTLYTVYHKKIRGIQIVLSLQFLSLQMELGRQKLRSIKKLLICMKMKTVLDNNFTSAKRQQLIPQLKCELEQANLAGQNLNTAQCKTNSFTTLS